MTKDEQPSTGMEKLRNRAGSLRNRARGMLPFFSGVAAMLLVLLLYNLIFPENQLTQTEVNEAIANAMASATPRPAYSTEVYKIIQPSIVLIQVDKQDGNKSLGSGVIVDEAGDILTSLHVVAGAAAISITFADGTKSEGIIASEQPEMDIAVLQAPIMPQLFVPATLGNPGALQVGDEVYAVGHPFGLYGSMSAGVISGFDRTFRPDNSEYEVDGLIQFDAAVNPGNSGGPLLNRYGHVVGIVTGIVNPSEQNFFIGIAFAVPINMAAGGVDMPPY
jgi:Trypsin-like serine proteases, typically periplasmic, contain C-terminal PDZ domain